jgi:hypothetical protein
VSLAQFSLCQTVNWRSLQSGEKHIVNLNAGWDYSANFGVSYGYRLNSGIPLIIGTEFSLPTGKKSLDDFKTKLGVQAEIFHLNHFSATVKVHGIYRQYQSEFVSLSNFGSELSALIGYYRPRWYSAIELGFDKAIITHIDHSSLMEEYYPEIKDGWYIPSGGNFSYGLQVGYSVSTYDIYFKTGKIVTQDFRTKPSMPLYLQLGFSKRF